MSGDDSSGSSSGGSFRDPKQGEQTFRGAPTGFAAPDRVVQDQIARAQSVVAPRDPKQGEQTFRGAPTGRAGVPELDTQDRLERSLQALQAKHGTTEGDALAKRHARDAADELSMLQLMKFNAQRNIDEINNMHPLTRVAGLLSPVPIKPFVGAMGAISGLFGEPTGMFSLRDQAASMAQLEREGREHVGSEGGNGGLQQPRAGLLTPEQLALLLQRQLQGQSQQTELMPKFSGGSLLPTLNVGGRSLSDILSERSV